MLVRHGLLGPTGLNVRLAVAMVQYPDPGRVMELDLALVADRQLKRRHVIWEHAVSIESIT